MSDIAIRAENLSKEYRIGARLEKYPSLRASLAEGTRRLLKRASAGGRRGKEESFWALREVSFEVKRGDVVGIIGRNGAGKSTLLKILSRITDPTTGMAEIHGRVGSLLEVGTGFHPELSGRENIFLNGAILGMRKAEIERRFDEIVAFAGVEKFVETPVKNFSSGMYLRLAFAVAVHLESEILLVDEVLAVGDAQFQKKCLDKMRDVSQGGRTVLLVSHNMSAIRNICDRGIILEDGRLIEEGDVNKVADDYLARVTHQPNQGAEVDAKKFTVHNVEIYSTKSPVIKTFDPLRIEVTFTPKVDLRQPGLYVAILTTEHQRLAGLDYRDFEDVEPIQAGQKVELGFEIDELPLLPGNYIVEVYLKDASARVAEQIPRDYAFEVVESAVYGSRKLDRWHGYFGLHVRATHAGAETHKLET